MKINNLLKMFMGALMMTFIISSCADDFTEEDLLQAQYDLQEQQQNAENAREDSIANANRQAAVDQLNAAGDLASLSVTILNLDGSPADGVNASLTSGGNTAEVTAGADGIALFESVTIGSSTLRLSGDNIYDAVLSVDMGDLNDYYTIVEDVIVPENSAQSIVVSVINTNAATATISGTVTFESDLTNDTPEVPQDLTLIADFDDNVSGAQDAGLVEVANYAFSITAGSGIGRAAVDNTTGAYSMTIPAGVRIDVNVPDFSAEQTLAISQENSVALDAPEYRTVTTNFGSTYTGESIPAVVGARAVFSEPSAAGSGFDLASWAKVGREYNFTATSNLTTSNDYDNSIIRFTTLGAGYENSPAVTITDPTADTTKYAEAHIEISRVSAATLTEAGAGYAASTDYNFSLAYNQVFQDGNSTSTDTSGTQVTSGDVTISTDASGNFTQAAIDAGIEAAIDANEDWFDGTYRSFGVRTANLRLRADFGGTTRAEFNVTAADGRIDNFAVSNGDGYTNPSFTLTGGGASTQGAVVVEEFATKWSFDFDNTESSNYSTLPSIEYEYTEIQNDATIDITTSDDFDIYRGTSLESGNEVLNGTWLTTRDGEVVFIDGALSAITNERSTSEPVSIIGNVESEVISKVGSEFFYINSGAIDMETGEIDASLFNFNIDNGDGYLERPTVTIEPSIEGAPGSDATVLLTDITINSSGEYVWNVNTISFDNSGNVNVTNGGSGYLRNLNQVDAGVKDFNSGGSLNNFELDEGQVVVRNIRYGIGERSVDVN